MSNRSLVYRISRRLWSCWPDGLFVLTVGFFLVLFLARALAKYNGFGIYGYDFAVFDQTIWNSANGSLFQNTIVPDAPFLLGQRFSPILLALAPLYSLHDQRLLVIIPPIAVALAAIPFYWFARERIGRVLALIVCLAYFLSPGVQLLGVGQFYETYLALVFLSLGTMFLLKRLYPPFLVCLFLTLMCKEEMGVVAAGLGLYVLLIQRKPALGLALFFGGLVWSILLIDYVIPSFSGQISSYYFGGSPVDGAGHYDYLGYNIPDIAKTAFTRPDTVLQHVWVPSKTEVLAQFFLSLGLLPIVGVEVAALALPTLGYTFLSDIPGQYALASHHHAPIYPFLVFGSIVGIERILRSRWRYLPGPQWRQASIGIFLLLIAGIDYNTASHWQIEANLAAVFAKTNAHDVLGDTLIKEIPPGAAVVTQQELLPHLTQRSHIYLAPIVPCYGIADYVLVDTTRPWYGYQTSMWNQILARPYYATVAEQDGYILKVNRPLERLEQTLDITAGKIRVLGYRLPVPEATGGQAVEPVLAWRASREVGAYAVRLQLVDAQGHIWAEETRQPCQATMAARKNAELFNDDFRLWLPPTIPSGDYSFTVAFLAGSPRAELPMRDESGRERGPETPFGSLRVHKNKNSFPASQVWGIERRIFIDLGEMRILGYTPTPDSIPPGEMLQIGVYWRAREKPRGDYIVAVQLRDASGRVAAEQSSRPANDTYATPLWNQGEVLLDWHDVQIPPSLAEGTYQIAVLLRDSMNQQTIGETLLTEISVTR